MSLFDDPKPQPPEPPTQVHAPADDSGTDATRRILTTATVGVLSLTAAATAGAAVYAASSDDKAATPKQSSQQPGGFTPTPGVTGVPDQSQLQQDPSQAVPQGQSGVPPTQSAPQDQGFPPDQAQPQGQGQGMPPGQATDGATTRPS